MYKSQELDLTRAVPINIGRQGQTGARSVEFDVTSLVSGYSGYEIVLAQQRSRDTDAFNIESTLSGNTLTWNVDDYDTYYSGIGRIEIRLIKDGVVVKSAIAYTYCEPSLTGNGTAPSAPPTWYNALINDVAENTSAIESIGNRLDADEEQIARLLDVTGLPEGYYPTQTTSSIEDAQQHLTMYRLDSDCEVQLRYKHTGTGIGLFGMHRASTTAQSYGVRVYDDRVVLYYGNGNSPLIVPFASGTESHVIRTYKGRMWIDGNVYGTQNTAEFTTVSECWLFAEYHYSGSAYVTYFSGDIDYCIVRKGGVQVAHYVPCVNEAGAVGMYDLTADAALINEELIAGEKLSITSIRADVLSIIGNASDTQDIVQLVDSVLCSTAESEQLTAEQKGAAQRRLGIVVMTQEEYDLITVKGESSIYVIVG